MVCTIFTHLGSVAKHANVLISWTFANNEDPGEMQPYATFHQGRHCLLSLLQPSGTKIHHNSENSICDLLKYKMDYSLPNEINMYGEIHQTIKRFKLVFFL